MNKWIDASAYWGRWCVRTPGVDDLGTFVKKMDALEIATKDWKVAPFGGTAGKEDDIEHLEFVGRGRVRIDDQCGAKSWSPFESWVE